MNRRDMLKYGAALTVLKGLPEETMADQHPALFVPPEEAPHQMTFMQWPASRAVHPDRDFLDQLQQTISKIADTISQFEPVVMLAAAEDHGHAEKRLSSTVELWDVATEDLWCRDSGPLFALNGAGALVVSHIAFNGWGNKQVHDRDGRVAAKVAERLGIPLEPSGLVGEAGGVEQDGRGLLMAHESCWVNDNRNPTLNRNQIESRLLRAYGASKMIWSTGVRDADITDYHIDSLARFSGPARVLITLPERPDNTDPFHLAALETYKRLKAEKLEIDVVFEPERTRIKAPDFVASYVNYYVCNHAVIAAQFGDRDRDRQAVKMLQRHYPDREIVTLNVDALGEIGGGIHCATQQMPKL